MTEAHRGFCHVSFKRTKKSPCGRPLGGSVGRTSSQLDTDIPPSHIYAMICSTSSYVSIVVVALTALVLSSCSTPAHRPPPPGPGHYAWRNNAYHDSRGKRYYYRNGHYYNAGGVLLGTAGAIIAIDAIDTADTIHTIDAIDTIDTIDTIDSIDSIDTMDAIDDFDSFE